jgi:hypothetical protein
MASKYAPAILSSFALSITTHSGHSQSRDTIALISEQVISGKFAVVFPQQWGSVVASPGSRCTAAHTQTSKILIKSHRFSQSTDLSTISLQK